MLRILLTIQAFQEGEVKNVKIMLNIIKRTNSNIKVAVIIINNE